MQMPIKMSTHYRDHSMLFPVHHGNIYVPVRIVRSAADIVSSGSWFFVFKVTMLIILHI